MHAAVHAAIHAAMHAAMHAAVHAAMHAAMEVSHGHSSSREPANHHLRGVALPVTLVSGPRSDCACRKERQEE